MRKQERKNTKKNIGRRIALIIIGLLLTILIGGYISGAVYYQSHFLPNTTINGMACDNLEIHEAKELLSLEEGQTEIELIGRDENGEQVVLGSITGEDIGLKKINYVIELHKHLDRQNPWLWIKSYVSTGLTKNVEPVSGQEFTISSEAAYDEAVLKEKISQMLKKHNANAIQPQNAYISEYSAETNSYEIVPEQLGNALDQDAVQKAVQEALSAGMVTSIDLEKSDCYAKPEITADDSKLITAVETVNTWLQAEITYDWNTNKVVVGKDLLKEWVSIQNDKPQLDEEAIKEFVAKQASAFDTYGKNRNFRTTLGVDLNLPSGAFGWKTDCEAEVKELTEAIKSGEKISKEPVYSSKAPWKGTNDIGNSYVEIDLTNQHLYLYQKGTIVLESEFVSGDMDGDAGCATPAGVFGLTYKTMNAVLRGADYETPVVYWMPYHGNFGMHDATWRTEFGGDIYLTDGSHGCVNLPLESAAAIYSQIGEGFPVICYYY